MRLQGRELDRVVHPECGEPQIDQLDRLALEEERIALAIEPAERVDQRGDPICSSRDRAPASAP